MKVNNSTRPVFLVTVDTEEEWDWSGDFPTPPFSTQNIRSIPKFQQFCQSLGITPTYFVDYAVADNAENRDILKHYFDRGECDIGAHLHPWCTPPIVEEISDFNSHAINLSTELFERKMTALTDLLVKSFDMHPLSFRSGRWGLNGKLLQILSNLDYKVDSSVRPFYRDSCFTYQQAPTRPYWPSFANLLDHDDSQREILEIPVSSGYNYPWFEVMDKLHNRLEVAPFKRIRAIGILWRLGLLRKTTITPEGHNSRDICRCMDMCVKRGDRLINLFFHSSDLMPGNTEYVKTKADETAFYNNIKYCVQHAQSVHNAEFITMRDAYDMLKVA